MLSSVTSSVPQLTPLPIGPDDAPQLCASRKKSPPATAEVDAATTRATTASTADTQTSGAARTSRSKTAHPRAKPSARGYASSSSSTKPSSTKPASGKAAGPLAFLDDPKLSVEEKLLKLLGYLNDKWNKELDQKMKEFKQPSSGTASSTSAAASASSGASGPTKSSSSSGGGLLKKAVGYASQAIPGLGLSLEVMKEPAVRSFTKAVAGPALAAVATYYGQPQLAPIAMKLGPELADAAANAASAVTEDGGASGSSTGSSGLLSGLFSGASSGDSGGALSGITSGLLSGTSSGDSGGLLSGITSGLSSGTSPGASSANPSAPSTASTSSGATSKESANGIGSDRDAQLRLMEMQRIIDQQKEMFSLVSNLLRATHETRMAVVQNVR